MSKPYGTNDDIIDMESIIDTEAPDETLRKHFLRLNGLDAGGHPMAYVHRVAAGKDGGWYVLERHGATKTWVPLTGNLSDHKPTESYSENAVGNLPSHKLVSFEDNYNGSDETILNPHTDLITSMDLTQSAEDQYFQGSNTEQVPNEVVAKVRGVINSLKNDRDREVFYSYYGEQLSERDVAKKLGVSDKAVRVSKARIAKAVERELRSNVFSTHPEGWINEVHERVDAKLHQTHIRLNMPANATLEERLEAEDAMKARRSRLQEHRRMAVLRDVSSALGLDKARTALEGGDVTVAAHLLRVPVSKVDKVAGELGLAT